MRAREKVNICERRWQCWKRWFIGLRLPKKAVHRVGGKDVIYICVPPYIANRGVGSVKLNICFVFNSACFLVVNNRTVAHLRQPPCTKSSTLKFNVCVAEFFWRGEAFLQPTPQSIPLSDRLDEWYTQATRSAFGSI